MRLLILLLFLIVSQKNVLGQTQNDDNCCEDYCYNADTEKLQTKHYSTKTAYEFVKGLETDLRRAITVPRECKPTKIWILSRHGTRLPDAKFIKQMGKLTGVKNEIARNYENRALRVNKGKLCPPDLINIKVWKVNTSITTNKENELVPQGLEDLRLLAVRYQRLFPELLNQTYSPDKFWFHSTEAKRTKDSLMAFAMGLFGPGYDIDKRILNDSFIRPHEACDIWEEQNNADKSNPESEIGKFEASDIFNKTVLHISKRLGFQYLENSIVELIWDMCRYEQAWFLNRVSAWCAAFTPTQNQVLEYKQDLKYYYKTGHGHELNKKMACFTVQDMLRHLDKSDSGPQVITYFSHSALIQMFLVALGLFKDNEALRADNIDQMKDRQWQMSSLSPFASNFVAVKYNCGSGDPKVLFLLNEKPLNIEGCSLGLCDWSHIMQKYEHFYNANCQEFYCSSTSGLQTTSNILILSFFMYLLYLIIKY